MIQFELKEAALAAGASPVDLSRATGIPRQTFHKWFRPAPKNQPPGAARIPFIQRLIAALRGAVDSGELPAGTHRETVAIIAKWMSAAQD